LEIYLFNSRTDLRRFGGSKILSEQIIERKSRDLPLAQLL